MFCIGMDTFKAKSVINDPLPYVLQWKCIFSTIDLSVLDLLTCILFGFKFFDKNYLYLYFNSF